MILRWLLTGLAVCMILPLHGEQLAAQGPELPSSYGLVCGEAGSLPYMFGVGLGALVKLELMPRSGLDVSPVPSGGNTDSIDQLTAGTAHFAIVGSVAAQEAMRNGWRSADGRPGRPFSLIAALWDDVLHVLLAKDHVRRGTINDLAQVPTGIWSNNADAWRSAVDLLAESGDPIDVDHAGLLDQEWAPGLIAGDTVSAVVVKGPRPSHVIEEAMARWGDRAQLVNLPPDRTAKIGEGWHLARIEAGSYPGQEEPVDAAAETMLLLADAEIADEIVYQIIKVMFDNLVFLSNVHEVARRITIDQALRGGGLQLHPGAERYYREVGLLAANDSMALSTAEAGELLPGGDEPALAAVEPAGEVEDSALVFNFYFGLGATELSEEEQAKLAGFVRRIKRQQDRTLAVTITGSTYGAGSRETLKEIARRRARAVEGALLEQGLPQGWIQIVDEEEPPVLPDGANASTARKVEVKVVPATSG